MKTQTAIKIAIEAIEKRMQEISIDANLFRKGIVKSPYTERCHKKLERLEDAVKELRALGDEVALLEDVAGLARTICEVAAVAQTTRGAITCPHGDIPKYPTHAWWCDYCWGDLEESLAKLEKSHDST